MAKKEVTVHLADKADVEIGTARCGARLQGAVHTDDREKVTCGKCVSARPKMLVIDDLPPCTHFEFTDGAFCGRLGDDRRRGYSLGKDQSI